jgi:carboxyl-terminal processing protease
MKSISRLLAGLLLLLLPTPSIAEAIGAGAGDRDEADYVADVRFALDELEKQCGHFFRTKEIDWKKVSKVFLKEAKGVESDQEHLVLLVRLLARLEDGHAAVRPLSAGEGVKWPERPETTGPGMFWCRSGGKILVKNAWGSAASSGIEAGMEVVKVDGLKVGKWLEERIAERCDTRSFSTDDQAFWNTCHWGLAGEVGSRMKLELRSVEGKKKKRTVTCSKASTVPWGPVFFPEGLEGDRDIKWGLLPSGHGYIHLRRCRSNLPERIDDALAAVGGAPGLILDFRANGGGGFDHDAFLGRFVPEGKTLSFAKSYRSAGPHPYGGPIVVIVDANCRSAGETASGIFKEDGRAYMIGESNTAGMSSSKTTIDLPSGLFSLYVSVRSNKSRFNRGRGIEGIGVIPHEIVEYEAQDLAAGIDTLLVRAEELLAKFPCKDVPYDSRDFAGKK